MSRSCTLINFGIATATAIFAPAELTSIPRIVDRRNLMAANSIFVLTINATFAIGFGFLGPLVLNVMGPIAVYVVVATMFGLAALAILPLPDVRPAQVLAPASDAAGRAVHELFSQLREGVDFVRTHKVIAWSLAYLGISSSLIGVLGAIGPGFAVDILGLTPENFFFIMGPGRSGRGARHPVPELLREEHSEATGHRHRPHRDGDHADPACDREAGGEFRSARPPARSRRPFRRSHRSSASSRSWRSSPSSPASNTHSWRSRRRPSLQEDLPADVRGRIFGILNTLLSVASFLPVLLAPAIADILNIFFEGAGIPAVMAVLGATDALGRRPLVAAERPPGPARSRSRDATGADGRSRAGAAAGGT